MHVCYFQNLYLKRGLNDFSHHMLKALSTITKCIVNALKIIFCRKDLTVLE